MFVQLISEGDAEPAARLADGRPLTIWRRLEFPDGATVTDVAAAVEGAATFERVADNLVAHADTPLANLVYPLSPEGLQMYAEQGILEQAHDVYLLVVQENNAPETGTG